MRHDIESNISSAEISKGFVKIIILARVYIQLHMKELEIFTYDTLRTVIKVAGNFEFDSAKT